MIIFNQGNTEDRKGLFGGNLTDAYSGGIPVMLIPYALGVELSETAGLEMHMVADVYRAPETTSNVFAESRGGNAANVVMVGAHLDSVPAGPGINDNGSGSAVLLEVAEQMRRVRPRNKVRFAWWSAEESNLLGSNYYVANLAPGQLDRIALYLNFDMVGSPELRPVHLRRRRLRLRTCRATGFGGDRGLLRGLLRQPRTRLGTDRDQLPL